MEELNGPEAMEDSPAVDGETPEVPEAEPEAEIIDHGEEVIDNGDSGSAIKEDGNSPNDVLKSQSIRADVGWMSKKGMKLLWEQHKQKTTKNQLKKMIFW